jgi:glycosyltransferase involved in cell wall biosynthesis
MKLRRPLNRQNHQTLYESPEVRLVFLTRGEDISLIPELERALTELGCKVEVIRFPYFWVITNERLSSLRAFLQQRSANQFLIFCPDSTELFLEEPDFTLTYSAYRSWYSAEKMRIIPHLWSPIKAPVNNRHLVWNSKPPLRIGFMGNSHETSRLAGIIRACPKSVRNWFLNGTYVRYPRLRALVNDCGISTQHLNAFPRIEVLDNLKRQRNYYSDLELDLVERQSFNGSRQEKDEYVEHLSKNTYILCPRGTENYSYRIYETLSFGRVPVIIDTDVVLPPEINWDRLVVRVPYSSIDNLPELIRQDYNRHSSAAFSVRQQEAFSIMAKLQTMRWVQSLAGELLRFSLARGR